MTKPRKYERQYTLECRATLTEDDHMLIQATMQACARALSAAMRSLDPKTKVPMIGIFSDDYFLGHEEIAKLAVSKKVKAKIEKSLKAVKGAR